jgi:hypothetical protein
VVIQRQVCGKEAGMPQPIPKFLKVSPSPLPEGTLRVVPYGANLSLAFEGPDGAEIRLRPQLYGQFFALGVNQELDPQTARAVLEFLRRDMPRFYRLRAFLLREVPEGSSERTARVAIKQFSPDRIELLSFDSGQSYTVRINNGGSAECSCPDFYFRRRRAGAWCKHVKALHQELKWEFSPEVEEFPFCLPLWEMKKVSQEAKFIEDLGGLYEVMSRPFAERENYTRRRDGYDSPLLGVEFEIPEGRGTEMTLLLKVISVLKERGLVLSYERDSSVEGGEIKLTPFPATLEECLKKGKLLKDLRGLVKGLFISSQYSGLHVHINMWPFKERFEEVPELLLPFVYLLQRRVNLASIFGRGMNPYATRIGALVPLRYWWVNFMSLPYTVEVRLGCSKHGDPVKILLMALFMQRAFWAIMEGRLKVPSLDASGDQLISAFSSLLSEEERKYIVPLLKEALLSPERD